MSETKKPEAKSVEPKPAAKPPKMRRWGGIEYPEDSFVRVTFLATGGVNGQRFEKGKSGDVPKQVFEKTLKPAGQAVLYSPPKPPPAQLRPATDKGNFKRVK